MKINIKKIALALALGGSVIAAAGIPSKPNEYRLANDFAGIMEQHQVNTLEAKLRAIKDSTSNEICVVTLNDLEGRDKAEVATEIGQTWGIGGKKNNNGVVILVKPKIGYERGEAFIAVGYGLESVLDDATTFRIVNNVMIPHFRHNDYYGGINAAVNSVSKIAQGEYNEVLDSNNKKGNGIVFLIVFLVIVVAVYKSTRQGGNGNNGNGSNNGTRSSNNGPFIFIPPTNIGRSESWGSGSFGGGSFGGGGAGGSW